MIFLLLLICQTQAQVQEQAKEVLMIDLPKPEYTNKSIEECLQKRRSIRSFASSTRSRKSAGTDI